MISKRLEKNSKFEESPNIGAYRRGKERLFNYRPDPNWKNDYVKPIICEDSNNFFWSFHEEERWL
jgi:hypothetical protein